MPPLIVPQEQVWSWSYIQNYLVQQCGQAGFQDALFPVGAGGGVSVFWHRPAYQSGTPGMRKTEPGQSVVSQGQDLLDLPAHFPGRNLPDVSLDADPFTGFLLYFEGAWDQGYGGTSFVAPQLNGVSALLAQKIHGRVGLWNPMLYRYMRGHHHDGPSPFVDITAGDNWFYNGVPGYEPAAGLGVLDVANLAAMAAHDGAHHGHHSTTDHH